MQRRTSTTRRATALGVVVLILLRSAMALLAVGAAQTQARALVEVCTAFGVVTVVVDGPDGSAPEAPAHADPACGLGHCAPPLPAAPGVGAPSGAAGGSAPVPCPNLSPARDRSASWFAGLGHAPPPRG